MSGSGPNTEAPGLLNVAERRRHLYTWSRMELVRHLVDLPGYAGGRQSPRYWPIPVLVAEILTHEVAAARAAARLARATRVDPHYAAVLDRAAEAIAAQIITPAEPAYRPKEDE